MKQTILRFGQPGIQGFWENTSQQQPMVPEVSDFLNKEPISHPLGSYWHLLGGAGI